MLEEKDAQNENHGENGGVGGSSCVVDGVPKKRGRKSKKEKEDMEKKMLRRLQIGSSQCSGDTERNLI